MKLRQGFISNSSSTSFMITNTSNEKKTIVDFVEENPQLITQFVKEYDWYKGDLKFTQESLIKSAKAANIRFKPKQRKECIFGDEQHTIIGQVFDYILRHGGTSKSFSWNFNKFLR